MSTPNAEVSEEALDDLRDRYGRALEYFVHSQRAQWQRTLDAVQEFAGVRLDQLTPAWRKRVERCFTGVNEILSRYPIKTWEDYQLISADDLKRIETLILDIPSRRRRR